MEEVGLTKPKTSKSVSWKGWFDIICQIVTQDMHKVFGTQKSNTFYARMEFPSFKLLTIY